ncbi:zinc ABC transporter substrate-binding protein [Paenibacillus pasadenensis]|uniref:metal ABC transporter solute-binding protein, Zn/Mn family n=1 Tax=Paenibacillus pasadenensis TaxID=217090 RepID=UPI002041AB4F|nr:zinc ABC transporter substrate-binding protein [Paenibacillus pasadenensis]MCM3748229.1 zinc ABC transporter substrate-binding protein [Paenibacillus pasadenensis]
MLGRGKRGGRWIGGLLLAAALAVQGCAGGAKERNDGKIAVTATTGMIADAAKVVGGERVSVEALMGPGVDPHLYKASHGDMVKLDEADIVFYGGLHLEGKMTEVLKKLGQVKPVAAVTDTMPPAKLHESQPGSGIPDPHVWFDASLWIYAVEKVRDTLIAEDPSHEAGYRERADSYMAELKQLHAYALEQLGTVPQERRVLVTAHDAFGYFGRAYGLDVMGLQGMSTASEYGSKDVAALRDFLVERQIPAVFVESSIPRKSIESVLEGAAKLGHKVVIGGELFSDAMGEEGTPEGSYIGMFRHNVDTIAKALKGE